MGIAHLRSSDETITSIDLPLMGINEIFYEKLSSQNLEFFAQILSESKTVKTD